MNRRKLLGRFATLSASSSGTRPDYFRPLIEPLESRELLSAVTWTIDSAQSKTSIAIPDQVVNLEVTPGTTLAVTAQLRNQSGGGSSWTVGNTAFFGGTVSTDYVDGSSIQFTPGSVINGINSGSYRPDLGTASANPDYNPLTDPPVGTSAYPTLYSNFTYTPNNDNGEGTLGSTASAAAQYGARIHGVALGGLISADIAYMSIRDTGIDVTSPALTITAGSFPANTTDIGIVSGTLGLDGLNVPLAGDIPDFVLSIAGNSFSSTNTAPTATITVTGPLTRRLTMPISIPVSIAVSPDISPTPLTGTITGLLVANTTLVPPNSTFVGTKLFYKGSTKWNVTNNNLPGFSDDNAIAPDKSAYFANGAAASFNNVSSYTRGINGLMVDISGSHGTITANDFIFKYGNNNSPSTWATAPAPTLVTTRTGSGAGGSDRIELMWADNTIQQKWLEVVVKGNDTLGGSNTNTNLAASTVFFWGSANADSGAGDVSGFLVNTTDEQSARNDPHGVTNPATITDVNDFDRNGLVNSVDQGATRTYSTSVITQLKFLTVGAGGPFAPESSAGDNGIASALAAGSGGGGGGSAVAAAPPVAASSGASADSSARASYYQALGESGAGGSSGDGDGGGTSLDDLIDDVLA